MVCHVIVCHITRIVAVIRKQLRRGFEEGALYGLLFRKIRCCCVVCRFVDTHSICKLCWEFRIVKYFVKKKRLRFPHSLEL